MTQVTMFIACSSSALIAFWLGYGAASLVNKIKEGKVWRNRKTER